MKSSTTLYAVNLEEVIAAIGSKNDGLLNRMCEFVASFAESDDDDDDDELVAEISILLTNDGRIVFKGAERSLEEICRDIIAIESGTLEFVIEPPWTDRHDEIIRTTNEVIPRSGVDRVLTRFETDDPSIDTSPNVTWTRVEGADDGGPALEFGISPEKLSNLVQGQVDGSDPEYGKAFEVLCYVLGMKLPDDGQIGNLAQLELDTLLATPRNPVDLGSYDGPPVISYQTAAEVLADALRLSKTDLSFPQNEDIEEAREAFLRCLKQAAIEGSAVISFSQ